MTIRKPEVLFDSKITTVVSWRHISGRVQIQQKEESVFQRLRRFVDLPIESPRSSVKCVLLWPESKSEIRRKRWWERVTDDNVQHHKAADEDDGPMSSHVAQPTHRYQLPNRTDISNTLSGFRKIETIEQPRISLPNRCHA